MREIKFRTWDKEFEEYDYTNDGSHFIFPDILQEKDLIIEQYTGLKDKNGKEIYEGDILKRKDFLFYDGNFIFLPVEYKYAEWELGMRRLNDVYKSCEVVGNIHDNPELSRTMEVSE